MSTLSEITKAVQEIRKILQQSLTPEFFNSVKSACDSIARLLNDTTLTQEVKDILSRLNQLLQKVEDEGFIQKATALVAEMQKKLSELDMESCNKILKGLGDLLEQITNAHFIEHMVDALKAAKSIGDFFDVAKNFMGDPAMVLMTYGPYAAIVGLAMTKILNQTSKNSGDSVLIKHMQEMNESLRTLAITNIHNLRQKMFNTYRQITLGLKNQEYDFDPLFRQQMIEERDYAFKFINTVPRMREQSLLALASIENKLEELIEKFVTQEIHNQSLEQFLNYIGSGYQQYWKELLYYTVYSQQIGLLSAKVKPKISRHELNYESICRLYGTQSVNALMQKLSEAFFTNGGGELYYELVNSLNDSAGLFFTISELISRQHKEPVNITNSRLLELALQLQNFYYNSAPEFIKEEWKKINWPVGYEHQEHHLNERMITIIQARAFAEYVRVNAAYFFGLYPIPRELLNGVLDIPRGFYQLFRHPIQTFDGVGNLLKLEGWQNLGCAFYYHPVRMLTPSLVGGATSYALKASSTSSSVTHLNNNFFDVTKFKSGPNSFSSSAHSASTLTKATTLAPSTLAAPAVLSAEGVQMEKMKSRKAIPNDLPISPCIDWDKLWIYVISPTTKQENEINAYQMIMTWYHEIHGEKPSYHQSKSFFHPSCEAKQNSYSFAYK